MKWVTRSGVRLDRAACIWLILRYIDPGAEIEYIGEEAIPDAVGEGALPFHITISEEPTSHERSSFLQLIAEYRLAQRDPALDLMSDIVYSAETEETGALAQGKGLSAIARGVNSLSSSDQDMVTRMLPVLDALYAYCKRRVEGRSDWANTEPGWGWGDKDLC